MRGRVLAVLITIGSLTGLTFSQVFDPAQSLGSSRHGLSQISMAQISGVVVGSDGSPLADVRIEVRNDQTGQTMFSAYTNESGAFEFHNLPSGQYEVVASRGLQEQREHLVLSDSGSNVKMRLDTRNVAAANADGRATVSVAEYKVPQKARDALHKAQEALSKGRRDEAEKQLAKSLEIYPSYAPALTLRGVLALDSNKPQPAMEDFDKAIHSDPAFAMAYTGMAAAMNQLQKFDDALRSAERSVSLAPQAWQTYFEMAKSYVGKSDFKDALAQLGKMQQFQSREFAPAHLLKAHVLIALEDYKDAMTELQAFVTLAPQDPSATAAKQAMDKIKAITAAAVQTPPSPAIH